MKKLIFLLSLGVLSLSACNGNSNTGEDTSSTEEASTSVYNPEDDGPYTGVGPYVKKVQNMPEDFVLGMDSSSVLSLEESGVKYYDFDGQEKDLFKILAGQGINTIRVRIWVDPWTSDGHGYGGGNVDIDRAVIIGKRVTAAGMKLMPNFHYSDFWADPGRQLAPKAWEGKTLEEKKTLLYNYTLESMQKFKDNNVAVSMVQIGNETTGGLAGVDHDDNYVNFSELVTQGTRAVKAVYPEAKTIVHFTNPEKG
ncbi:MAG: glycosyl hydrolase 53 family protein, partial [Bacilli bacterium]|nr:glycosyl hydrolase 53 family protein [Bacilli bacterium]